MVNETPIYAKVLTQNPRLETQDAQLDIQDVLNEMESTVQETILVSPDTPEALLRIPKKPLESFVGVGVGLNGHRTLRQFLISGISAFIALPIVLLAILDELKKKFNPSKIVAINVTKYPENIDHQITSAEGRKILFPLGWVHWTDEQEIYWSQRQYIESTAQYIVSPSPLLTVPKVWFYTGVEGNYILKN